MVFRLLSVSMAIASFAIASAVCQAAVTVDLNFANGVDVNTSNAEAFTFATNPDDPLLSGTTTSVGTVIDGVTSNATTVTLSDGEFTGVFELSFGITAEGFTESIFRGPEGSLGTAAGGLFAANEPFLTFNSTGTLGVNAVNLTLVSGDEFQFDGFTGVLFGNADAGEVGSVRDNDFAFGDAGTAADGGAIGPVGDFPINDFLSVSGEGLSLNVVRAQFSAVAVPEPSSLALFGLASLAVFRRRRR